MLFRIYIYEKIRYIQIAFVIVVVGMCSFFVVVGGCSFVGRSVNEREMGVDENKYNDYFI